MFDIGLPELIVILIIVVLLFGAKKLPELSKSIGESARELRKGINGEDDTFDNKATASTQKNSKKTS